MKTDELIEVYKTSLLAFHTHAVQVGMDDSDKIRIIRVLIDAAESNLNNLERSEKTIERKLWELTDYVRQLFIQSWCDAEPELAGDKDYIEESGEIFDYVFHNGRYPDDWLLFGQIS